MTKHAYSNLHKAQVEREKIDHLKDQAVERWKQEQEDPTGIHGKPRGLRKICEDISAEHLERTGEYFYLPFTTLAAHVKGGKTLSDFNAEKSWLTNGEATVVIDYALEMATRGWPFSRTRLVEHADEVIGAKLGDAFESVGNNWVDRFVTKNHDRLKSCWSSPLDHSRARAVNPHNRITFFGMYNDAREGCGNPEDAVPDHLVFAGDETGIQEGIGAKERVFGPVGASVQHQQRSGDRENITVLPTICADGTYLAPTTIFKGDGFQVKWCQENPLKST